MIEIILEDARGARRLSFEGLPLVVGRAEECDVVLEAERTSRRHLLIEREGGRVVARDLGSANGTRRGDEVLGAVEIGRGDLLELADEVRLTWLGESMEEDAPRIPVFALSGRIGTGPASAVWRARQEKMGRDVAIRLPRRRWQTDREVLHQFEGRARLQARQRVPGLAAGIDLGRTDSGLPWFAMELLPGETLQERVAREGPLELTEAGRCLRQILETLSALHRGDTTLGHLAPGDVMLDLEGRIALTGLGYRLPLGRDLGAEEDWVIEEAEGRAADLLLVAHLAGFSLTGEWPGPAQVAALEARELPPPFRRFLARLGAPEPGARPADASEALENFESVERALAVRAAPTARSEPAVAEGEEERPVARRDPTAHWSPRMKFVSGALSVLILVLLNLGVYFGWKALTAPDDEETEAVEFVDRSGGGGNGTPTRGRDDGGEASSARVPDPVAAAQELTELEPRLEELIAEERHSEAMVLLADFLDRHRGTEAGSRAVALAEKVAAARREALLARLAAVQETVEEGQLESARANLRALEAEASRFAPEEFERVQGAVDAAESARREKLAAEVRRRREEREAAARRAAEERAAAEEAGTEGGKPPEGGAAEGDPAAGEDARPPAGAESPKGPLPAELIALVQGAGSGGELEDRVTELLAAQGPHLDRGTREVVEGLERVLGRWPRPALALEGRDIRLELADGRTVEGRLEVEEERLLLTRGRKRMELGLDRLGASGIKGILERLEPTTDRYLARALLDAASGRAGDLWFDREAVLILLETRPELASAVDRTLRELGRLARGANAGG